MSEFYYKDEQRQSGNFQKKWDQGGFLSFKNVFSFFFQTRDRTAYFFEAGNDPKDVTKVMTPQEREGLLLE